MNCTIASELEQIRDQGLYRRLENHRGIDFCSNDFLGLSRSESIRQKLILYLQSGGPLGSTGSRLVSGNDFRIESAETLLAQIFQTPSALFLGSGYLANLGVTTALANEDCEFFSDEKNHASLIDGMRLSKRPVHIFNHNDLEHLSQLLSKSSARRPVIVTESVFSMDGDSPDLHQLKKICDQSKAFLILDEAHATGVMGPTGLGAAEGVGFDIERTVFIHTCGKALGGYGAFVTCSRNLRELIVNRARPLIYSTAPTPLQTLQTVAALDELRTNPQLRLSLQDNLEFLHRALAQLNTPVQGCHILSIQVTGSEAALSAANLMMNKGIHVRAIRYPTVAKGQERLRLTVKAFHTKTDLQNLIFALSEVFG